MAGLASFMLLTSCNKDDKKVETPTAEQQKLTYQAQQLQIEQQKLALEKEKFALDQQKKNDSVANAQKVAATTKPTVVNNYYGAAGTKKSTSGKSTYRGTSSSNGSYSNSNGSYASNGSNATVQKKKGMSSAAKGAIIGTVGGAAAGAIIAKKNRGLGAVIGGVLGAGTGYTIGRANDRKTGRVQ